MGKPLISIIFLLLFVHTTTAGVSDLEVKDVIISNPSPNDGTTSYLSGEDTFTEMEIVIFNNGDADLPVTSDGNYDLILSLEHADTNLQYDYTFTMNFNESDEVKKGESLPQYDSAVYDPNVIITVPTYACGNLSFLCITINHNSAADYTDPTATDDIKCIEFIDGSDTAGILQCTADLVASNFSISDPDSNFIYPIGTDKTITLDLLIDNIGWIEINDTSDSSANFEFTAFISSTDDLDDDNATYIEFDVDTSSAYNLTSGIAARDSIWIYDLKVDINIPREDCDIYEYVCLRVAAPNTADYIDGDTDNNEVCIEFGNVDGGYAGNSPCSGCAIQVSVGLLLTMLLCLLLMK